MRSPEDIIVRPYVTEKSNDEIAMGKYTFIVNVNASKIEIKSAVEKLFDVKVMKVNTLNYEGKLKRMGVHIGRRSSWKKAIVRIDLDPNGDKEKNVKVRNEDGKIVTEKKTYSPGSFYRNEEKDKERKREKEEEKKTGKKVTGKEKYLKRKENVKSGKKPEKKNVVFVKNNKKYKTSIEEFGAAN